MKASDQDFEIPGKNSKPLESAGITPGSMLGSIRDCAHSRPGQVIGRREAYGLPDRVQPGDGARCAGRDRLVAQ